MTVTDHENIFLEEPIPYEKLFYSDFEIVYHNTTIVAIN